MSSILGHLRGVAQGTTPVEMTAAEIDNMTIMIELTNLMTAMPASGTINGTDQEVQGLEIIEKWLTTKHDGLEQEHLGIEMRNLKLSSGAMHPDWRLLHESFLILEVLKALTMFFDYAAVDTRLPKIKLPRPAVDRTRELTEKVYQEIRSRSADIKNSLSESGVVGLFTEAIYEREQKPTRVIGAAIEDLISEPQLEGFISRVVDSWQEALEGVLKVKIK